MLGTIILRRDVTTGIRSGVGRLRRRLRLVRRSLTRSRQRQRRLLSRTGTGARTRFCRLLTLGRGRRRGLGHGRFLSRRIGNHRRLLSQCNSTGGDVSLCRGGSLRVRRLGARLSELREARMRLGRRLRRLRRNKACDTLLRRFTLTRARLESLTIR